MDVGSATGMAFDTCWFGSPGSWLLKFQLNFWMYFGRILDWFWDAFGWCFGGLFRNLGILFPSCVNIFDLFMLLERKIAKICSMWWAGGAWGGFWNPFWGVLGLKKHEIWWYFDWRKCIDVANGTQNLIKVCMVRCLVKSFRNASFVGICVYITHTYYANKLVKVFAALPVLPLFRFWRPGLPKGSKIL